MQMFMSARQRYLTRNICGIEGREKRKIGTAKKNILSSFLRDGEEEGMREKKGRDEICCLW